MSQSKDQASPIKTVDGQTTYRLSEMEPKSPVYMLGNFAQNLQNMKNEARKQRAKRAMERHIDHVECWIGNSEHFETYRSKRKTGQNRILGPKRTLIDMQNNYRDNVLPLDLKAQIE